MNISSFPAPNAFPRLCDQNQYLNTCSGQVNIMASNCFILLARLGKLPCHKKLGIFKFMFSLSDKFFIVHVLDFCGPKLDLRQYNIAI